jgi:AcrR family transcriptional regulator
MKSSSPRSTPSFIEPELTARERKALARREHILETALKLFARHGFDGTSTKQIAQAAGVAEGLIFHYFPTKDDLLNAVWETRHSFFGELRNLLEGAEDKPVAQLLQELANGWLSTLRREKDITLVLFSTAQINPKIGAVLRTLIGQGIALLSAYLRARVKAGELRKNLPVENSAQMFFSSLMIFFLVNNNLPSSEWEARSAIFVRDLLSIWLDGARP